MNARQLGMIAIAALLLIGGLTAVGAASPADEASTNATDAYDANASVDGEEANANESVDAAADNESAAADGIGPSDGLPAQVPDHVSAIHDSIESFLNGSIENLGESLNGLLSGGEADGDAAENPANAAVGGT